FVFIGQRLREWSCACGRRWLDGKVRESMAQRQRREIETADQNSMVRLPFTIFRAFSAARIQLALPGRVAQAVTCRAFGAALPAYARELGAALLPVLLLVLLIEPAAKAQTPASLAPPRIQTSSFDKEVTDFFTQEMTAHLNEIKSYDPAPDKVFGAGTTGEYTWGSFMNSVGAFAAMTERTKLGDRDLAREVGQVGLLEYRLKSTRFSQLYGVLALRYFGKNLDTNPVWQ